MKVLIDMDDVLVDMMTKAVWYFNHATGGTLSVKEINTWDLGDMRPEFEKIWRIPGFFSDLPFMDDCAESALHGLRNQGHEVIIVSAPPTWKSCEGKYNWVHTHLRIPGIIHDMGQLVLTRNKRYVEGDIMIDDRPENLEGRKYPILFDRPWNRDETRFYRAYNWNSIFNMVREIKLAEEACV